ncbi:lipase family protein [Acidisoma sp. 7E03]
MASDPLAPVLMTLAGLAYATPRFITSHLAAGPVGGVTWTLDWMADDVPDPINFAYLVRDGAGRHVLAIRGTYPDPFSSAYWADAQQDSPFGTMQPWPGAAEPDAKVSGGTWAGLQGLLALSGGSVVLADKLRGLGAVDLYFAGHSLGGTLAPVLALWTAGANPAPGLSVYAFAGMTPGNAAFAQIYAAEGRLAGRSWRYNNTLDTVPYGWDRVLDTQSFYTPEPQGGLLVKTLLLATAVRLFPYGYAAVGEEIKLPGVLRPPAVSFDLIAYLIENLHQHMPDTYLSLLGAPALPFEIGFGPFIRGRGAGADAALSVPQKVVVAL